MAGKSSKTLPQPVFKCEFCEKVLKTKRILRMHSKNYHEIKSFHCNICSKKYSNFQNLNNHMRTAHNGKKDNKCESCGKSFTQAGYLKKHIHIVHEGHKDHKCEYCKQCFSTKAHLNYHIKTHV